VSAALHVHVLGVRVVELAFTELAVEADDLPCCIILDLLYVFMA